MRPILLFLLAFALVNSLGDGCDFEYFPKPQQCTIGPLESQQAIKQPCKFLFKVNINQNNTLPHVREIISHYQKKHFGCSQSNILTEYIQNLEVKNIEYNIDVSIQDTELRTVMQPGQENYTLYVDFKNAKIEAPTYVGFLRGLESFYQTFNCTGLKNNCTLKYLPVNVTNDGPVYPWRALMIDTSHHYLPMKLILETIDGLMYNKMNVLHWHMVDEDYFPIVLKSHPEMAKYGAINDVEVYTIDQIKEIVRYATVRGVRVIPEIATPYHAASWGRAQVNEDIACTSPTSFRGSLDVTMDRTFEVIKDIFQELIPLFPDPYVHMGGYQPVEFTCAKNKSAVLAAYKLPANDDLILYYRKRQKQVLKDILVNKTLIYWVNTNVNILKLFDPEDIVHWYGPGYPPADMKNKKIVSSWIRTNMDAGVGNYLGIRETTYITWLELYKLNFHVDFVNRKMNALGVEVVLWSHTSNQWTHHLKLWMRASVIGEKFWNTNISLPKPDVMQRLVYMQRNMERRGIPASPVTCQICETHADFCTL